MSTNPKGGSTKDGSVDMISSIMSASEIIAILADHRCRDITSNLDLDKCGRKPIFGGGFGDVYQGTLKGGEKVAIKCARLYLQQDDRTARELHTWSRLKHKNIVSLFGLARFQDQMAMVSPWMDNGTLPHYVDHHPAADRLQLCLDISNGVAYLHQNDTIHEDLKGANVLISNSGIAKLADFGCAEPNPGTLHFTATTSGANYSIRWAAPEILNGEQTRSKEADVYALGMTFLEVITGEVPFSNKNDLGVYLAVAVKQQIPERPPNFPSLTLGEADQLWGIIVRSCAHEPLDRLGSTIVQSYVQSIRWHSTGHLLPNISVTGPDSSSNARPPQRFQDYFTEQLKLQEVSQVDPALDAGPPYFWNGTTRYPHPGACEWAEYYLNGGTDLTGLVYFTGPYGRVLTSIPPQEGFPVTGSDSGIIVEAQPAFSPPYLWNGTANYPSYGACKWANYYLCGGTDPTGLVYFTGRDGHVLTSIPPQ